MFRLAVIHQLVLSLIVGPMPCCCSAARLGCDPKPNSRVTAPAAHTQSRTCCGHGQEGPSDGGRPKPSDRPGDPAKCPCKDALAKATAAPEARASSADTSGLLPVGTTAPDLPVTLDLPPGLARPAAHFDHRSASPSAAELLYAHHNLRL